MKKLAILLLITFFLLSACEKPKPDIEIPLPSSPPNPDEMSPTSSPNQ